MKKWAFMLPLFLVLFMIFPNTAASSKQSSIDQEIIYDIIIDRFNNANQSNSDQVRIDDPYAYHGGDFNGITVKLDDLKELGFTTISLSPVMANRKDGFHGYWIEDFFKVEEQFGTMDDLKQLVKEAHDRDMKVVLEFVPNYIASSSPIVTDPKKKDWVKKDVAIDKANIPWLKHVVEFNQDHPEVEKYLLEAADFWIEHTNIDGFKLYAADQTSPDFLQKFTAHVKEKDPNFYIIATLLSDQANESVLNEENIDLVENKLLQTTLASVFSKPDEITAEISEVLKNTGTKKNLIYVDNKFTDRFTHKFGEQGRNIVTTWNLTLVSMYTLPGVPIIYQGSEIPMYGKEYPHNQTLMEFNSSDQDTREVFKKIASLRSKFPALKHGDYTQIATNQGLNVYKRSYQDETIYIAINNDSESRVVTLTDLEGDVQLRGLLGDNLVRQNKDGEYKIGLPRETAEVFIIEENTGLNWLFITPIIIIFCLFVGSIIYLSRKQKKIS